MRPINCSATLIRIEPTSDGTKLTFVIPGLDNSEVSALIRNRDWELNANIDVAQIDGQYKISAMNIRRSIRGIK